MGVYVLLNPEGRTIKGCSDLHQAHQEAAKISRRCVVDVEVESPEGEKRLVARYDEGRNLMPIQHGPVQKGLQSLPPWARH